MVYLYTSYTIYLMRYNPFNPQMPARPDFFVGREPEIKEFEHFLNQTIHGSPMNMSITGNRGIGKTSLLVKLEDIAKRNNCLTLRFSNYEGNIINIADFSDYVCANIKREILSRRPLESTVGGLKDWISTLKPQISYNDITLGVEKQHVIQEMLRQRMSKLWNEVQKEYSAVVLLVDEAESLEKIDGILPFLREVFQRLSNEAKYMIVLTGKLNFPERISESFSPLNRFFPSQKLKPFTIEEMRAYVRRKLQDVEITIDDIAIGAIAEKSEGHPYVLVAMLYTIFDSLKDDENKITLETIREATPKVDAQLAQDFFRSMYHPLTPKAKEIVHAITRNVGGVDFTFSEAVKWCGLKRSYVSPYIQELFRKGILNKPERAKYQIFHKLFVEYVKSCDPQTSH